MSGTDEVQSRSPRSVYLQRDFLFAVLLFLAAAIALSRAAGDSGVLAGAYGWRSALFFLCFGMFTITMGYARPHFGHVSFDRVAQVSSILVLGPVDAAWINGLASLIYPLHRFRLRVPTHEVLMASLHNSGMMTLIVLGCGSLYRFLDGPIPLTGLDPHAGALILLLGLSMQATNDGIMAVMMSLRGKDPSTMLNVFSIGVELASVPLAVLVAIVFSSMSLPVFVLLLVSLTLGMIVLKQLAEMRNRLEALVEKRTEQLRVKTLELEHQATRDKLTGLYNRRFADDFLQREIDNARRNGRELTIALADIDHFKQVNDRHSHAIGDKVLCRVSEIFVARCRKTDMVARYGGEEFLLCFPDTSASFAEQICTQIRKSIERTDWSDIADDVGITISFGIAEVGRDSRRTTILSDADTRLYQAKHKGRNRIVGLP